MQIATLYQDNSSTKIWPEYANYANILSPDLAMELSENTGINKHNIELLKGK